MADPTHLASTLQALKSYLWSVTNVTTNRLRLAPSKRAKYAKTRSGWWRAGGPGKCADCVSVEQPFCFGDFDADACHAEVGDIDLKTAMILVEVCP